MVGGFPDEKMLCRGRMRLSLVILCCWLCTFQCLASSGRPPKAGPPRRPSARKPPPLRQNVASLALADSYRGPWMFDSRDRHWRPVKTIDNSYLRARRGPLAIRLDGGRRGFVSIRQQACAGAADCSPADCGCFAEDSYMVRVTDDRGRKVAETQLWAAYGNYQLAAADLLGGDGDELLVVRQPNRGSPVYRYDLKVMRIGGKKIAEIGRIESICDWLYCCGCSVWRDDVTIVGNAKPYDLTLRRRVLQLNGCAEGEPEKEVGRRRVVSYRHGAYNEWGR